jgi:hypothetical protein
MRVQRIRSWGGAILIFVALAMIALFTIDFEPAAGALSIKACQLITATDVQGVLGNGYTQEDLLENEITSVCGYKKGDGNAIVVHLSQSVTDVGVEQAGIRQHAGKSVTVTSVDGLGEGAFYFVDDKQNFQLIFGKGGRRVGLSVLTGRVPNIDAALKLGKVAYPRLR